MNLNLRPETEALLKRIYFLAYEAAAGAGYPGMCALQARDGVTEDQVWQNVLTAGDYPGGGRHLVHRMKRGEFWADYVFGRMLKLSVNVDEDGDIKDVDRDLDAGRQAWVAVYASYADLIQAAKDSLAP